MRISKFHSRTASLCHSSCSSHLKDLPVRSPKFPQFVLKTTLPRHYVMRDGNIQYANSISRFFDIYCGITNCCGDDRCTEPS